MRFFANEEREFTIMCEVMEKAEEKVRSRSKLSVNYGYFQRKQKGGKSEFDLRNVTCSVRTRKRDDSSRK